jgi:hypothetical protein
MDVRVSGVSSSTGAASWAVALFMSASMDSMSCVLLWGESNSEDSQRRVVLQGADLMLLRPVPSHQHRLGEAIPLGAHHAAARRSV